MEVRVVIVGVCVGLASCAPHNPSRRVENLATTSRWAPRVDPHPPIDLRGTWAPAEVPPALPPQEALAPAVASRIVAPSASPATPAEAAAIACLGDVSVECQLGFGELGLPRAPGSERQARLAVAIARVMESHAMEVRACRNPPNEPLGDVTIRFIIAATGRIEAAAVRDSSLGDPAAVSCVIERLRGWDFPKPEGGAAVVASYRFVL